MIQRILEPEVMDTIEEARDYDSMDHTVPNHAFVDRLVELGAFGHMLDIGTGPGHIPLLICQRVAEAKVIGIDLSQNMLDIADQHLLLSPHTEQITFQLVDGKALEYADASFDTVFSNTILHHLEDPRPVLREAWRVLRPGGALLIRDLYRPDSLETVEKLVAEHAAGANAHQQQLFRQSLIAAFTPDEMRAIVEEVEMPGVEVVVDTDRHMSIQKRAQP